MKKQQQVPSYQASIGRVVTKLRTEKGWTQADLAEAIGSSQSAIHRIEKGHQNVSLEQVKKDFASLR